jgi:ADP-ribose pyrophosphatase
MTLSHSEEQKNSIKKLSRSPHYLYQGKILSLKLDVLHQHPPLTLEIVEHKNAAVILALTEEDSILLVKQYRPAIDEIVIELPAGILEEHETPLDTAQRELQEETGYFAHKMTPLTGFYASPGFCTEYISLFLAQKLERKPKTPDPDEAIDLLVVSKKEALELLYQQKIRDAKTIAGILYYLSWESQKNLC